MGQHIFVEEWLSLDLVRLEVIQLVADDMNRVNLFVDGSARSGDLRPEGYWAFLGGEAAACLIRAKVDDERLTMHAFQVLIRLRQICLDVGFRIPKRTEIKKHFFH